MRVVGEIANERFKEMKELIDKKYYLNQSDFVRQAVLNELSKMKEQQKLKFEIEKRREEKLKELKKKNVEEFIII